MNFSSLLLARWQALARRERQWLLGAALLVLAALVWWLAISPALLTLRSAASQRLLLDAQLQQMHSLQAQAKALQAQPRIAVDEARRLLDASVKSFGATAQLQIAGDRATVTFKGASADALAQWLLQVRLNVRAVPGEARLLRGAVLLPVGLVLLGLAGARLESIPGGVAVLWGLVDVILGGYPLIFDKPFPGSQRRFWRRSR